MKRIIVIGSIHHNTLGMIRCIGKAKYKTDLILTDSDGFVSKSKYVNNTYIAKTDDSVIAILQNNYQKEIDKPIIITCSDTAQHIIDEKFDSLSNRFELFNCGVRGKVSCFMNKQTQCDLAKSVGIDIPVSYINGNSESTISFPCLLKSLKSIDGGKKIMICQNQSEFEEGLKSFDSSDRIIVQEYIKKEKEIVLLGLSVNGDVIIPGYIVKHRDYCGGTLYSSVESSNILPPDFLNKCKQLVSRMNYEGLWGIEFIYSKGKYYFIEINLRNDATTYAMAIAGVNLPGLYVKAKTYQYKLPSSYKVKKIKSIVEFNDFKHRKYFGISIPVWIKQFLNAKCKYYFDFKDPLPFFYAPFKNNDEN